MAVDAEDSQAKQEARQAVYNRRLIQQHLRKGPTVAQRLARSSNSVLPMTDEQVAYFELGGPWWPLIF